MVGVRQVGHEGEHQGRPGWDNGGELASNQSSEGSLSPGRVKPRPQVPSAAGLPALPTAPGPRRRRDRNGSGCGGQITARRDPLAGGASEGEGPDTCGLGPRSHSSHLRCSGSRWPVAAGPSSAAETPEPLSLPGRSGGERPGRRAGRLRRGYAGQSLAGLRERSRMFPAAPEVVEALGEMAEDGGKRR